MKEKKRSKKTKKNPDGLLEQLANVFASALLTGFLNALESEENIRRIDSLFGRRIDQIGEKIKSLGTELGTKMDTLGTKIDTLGTKIDTLGAKMDENTRKIIEELGTKIDRISG
jgi:outer membrane murein-binding lipoprotein Lpp